MNKKISFFLALAIIIGCATAAFLIVYNYDLIPRIGEEELGEETPTSPQKSCEQLYEEIENDFDKTNYCENDSDCKAVSLGGPYIEFGCWKYVNKAADENEFLRRVEEYDTKCDEVINECMPTSEATCVSGKCVYLEEDETADWKTYTNNQYGFEIKFNPNWEVNYYINYSYLYPQGSGEEITTSNNSNEILIRGIIPKDAEYSATVMISVKEHPSKISLDELSYKGDFLISKQEINIDGYPAYDEIYSFETICRRGVRFVKDNNKEGSYEFIIAFTRNDTSCGKTKVDNPEFNQMLSTFRFID